MRRLDRIDQLLIHSLQKNARLSNKELAAAAGLAQSTCLERVKRLVNGGVLTGFHAVASPEALGITIQAHVAVRLKRHAREQVESFKNYALALPEVLSLTHTAGENDFLLHIGVRNTDHLRQLTLEAFTTREEVSRIETSILFEKVTKHRLPVFLSTERTIE